MVHTQMRMAPPKYRAQRKEGYRSCDMGSVENSRPNAVERPSLSLPPSAERHIGRRVEVDQGVVFVRVGTAPAPRRARPRIGKKKRGIAHEEEI